MIFYERRLDYKSILLRSGRAVAHARKRPKAGPWRSALERGERDFVSTETSEAALRGKVTVKCDRLNARSAMPCHPKMGVFERVNRGFVLRSGWP